MANYLVVKIAQNKWGMYLTSPNHVASPQFTLRFLHRVIVFFPQVSFVFGNQDHLSSFTQAYSIFSKTFGPSFHFATVTTAHTISYSFAWMGWIFYSN